MYIDDVCSVELYTSTVIITNMQISMYFLNGSSNASQNASITFISCIEHVT